MSPLIDVTNTEVVTLNEERSSNVINSDTVKSSKNSAARNNCQNDNETKFNSSGIRRHIKKKKLRNHLNTKCAYPSSDVKVINRSTNDNDNTKVHPRSVGTSLNIGNNLQIDDARVPPIPDVEFLSKAVDTLSIASVVKCQQNSSQFKIHFNSTNKNTPTIISDIPKQSFQKQKSPQKKFQNQIPQGGKVPLKVYSGTYQCVACKLEFSNVDNLTTHLVKHIYEGLHAAAWLNNAMTTLILPVTTTNSQTHETSVTKTNTQFPSDNTNSSG